MLFSKRYRGVVSTEDGGGEFSGSNMRNATFTTQPTDNPLEPVQLEELQLRHQQQHGVSRRLTRQIDPRSASMMNLGGGPRSSSMMNLGGSSSNNGGSNLMMQLQQLQQQSKGNATWNSSGNTGNAAWGGSSASTPPARNMFLQSTRPSSSHTAQPSIGSWGQAPSSSNANAFASIFGNANATQPSSAMNSMMHRPGQQQEQAASSGSSNHTVIFGSSATATPPSSAMNSMMQRPGQQQKQAAPSRSSDNMTFFTGMGSVTGEDDEAALQRWIDRMAEEELG